MATGKAYEIDDAKTFDQNIEAFCIDIETIDPSLGTVLKGQLKALAAGSTTNADVWDALIAATATPVANGAETEGNAS